MKRFYLGEGKAKGEKKGGTLIRGGGKSRISGVKKGMGDWSGGKMGVFFQTPERKKRSEERGGGRVIPLRRKGHPPPTQPKPPKNQNPTPPTQKKDWGTLRMGWPPGGQIGGGHFACAATRGERVRLFYLWG